jgi:hypothetical protein
MPHIAATIINGVPRRVFVLLVFLAATFVGLYFASQAHLSPAFAGMVPWSAALEVNLTYYYLWALSVPLVIAIIRRFPFDERRWAVPLVVHLVASGVIAAVIIVIAEVILKFVIGLRTDPILHTIRFSLGINFHSNVPTYWMIVLAYLSFQYYARFRDRELRASQLETRLSEARLDALKMQLRPHFLFNTLNSISSLMYSDVEAADTMITRLGDFLRLTIESDHEQLIPLRQELEFVRRYLEIEQIRFEDRLRIAYDVEPRLLDALVPSLVLQPLVENAIHHAIAPREEGGRIAVRATESGGRLTLMVDDDGPGLRAQSPERVRVGLGATRARLEQLYGDQHELRFSDSAEGGLAVAVAIPLQFREGPP